MVKVSVWWESTRKKKSRKKRTSRFYTVRIDHRGNQPPDQNRKKFANFPLGNEARPQKMASTPLERAVEKQIEVILKNPGEAWDRRVKALNALSSIFEE